MIDIKFIRENTKELRKALKDRGVDFDLERFLEVDEKRRSKIKEVDDLRSRHNEFSDEAAKLKGGEKDKKIEDSKKLKANLSNLEAELRSLEEEFTRLMYKVPNVPSEDVPIGKDESENKVLKEWGKIPKFSFDSKDHVEIGEKLGIIDIERAAKVSGARFGYLKGEAALLEFALIQFTFQTLTSREVVKKIADSIEKDYPATPFIPVVPPVMIRPEVFKKMARLSEEDKEERYYLEKDDLYLVGSAEHTMGSMYMDEIFEEERLPQRYLGFSTSFRREAGSYGKDTRGMLRVHQFDKIEMESFTLPEYGRKEHEFFIAVQEYLMQKLKIPYRVVMLCTGDMGKPNVRQVDIEAWMPGQGKYRETHTADFMGDFQARRLMTRVRRRGGNLEFVHMNDATTFAIGRTLIAILENYQEEDGSVVIPKVLQPYLHGIDRIKRNT